MHQSVRARHLGELALRAMLHEAAVTHKPGLVCPDSSGAHTDMDIQLFFASAAALHPFFRHAAAFGLVHADHAPETLFPQLRDMGKRAEKRMFVATGGVNTHKGLIFSLGLLCAGAGRLMARCDDAQTLDAVSVTREAAAFVRGLTERELVQRKISPHARNEEELTAGKRFFRHAGATGIRGEVESGFPHARQAALILHEHRKRGWNTAALLALLSLMAEVEDSVIWNRGGASGLQFIRQESLKILSLPPESDAWRDALLLLNRECVRRNLSPGGCADLLAAAFFLRFVEDEPLCLRENNS